MPLSLEYPLIVMAHPGHELRVLQFIRKHQPLVVVLTDGSGSSNQKRLELSRQVLQKYGAKISEIYGVVSDYEFYQMILEKNSAFFLKLVNQIADLIMENFIDCVIGDALEGYNPSHDICRLLIDKAISIASEKKGKTIKNYAFSLTANPVPQNITKDDLFFDLSAEELALKRNAAYHYIAEAGGTLSYEFDLLLKQYGETAFAKEYFWSSNTQTEITQFKDKKPHYEVVGEQRCATGIYNTVIRYEEHIVPLVSLLS